MFTKNYITTFNHHL